MIRWGVLSASAFGRNVMIPALHSARGGRVASIATSQPEKLGDLAMAVPDLRVVDSYEDVLADPQIDAVYIPLPNHLHTPWALKALEAGKHVLCEKPIGGAVRDVDALIAARDRSGKFCAEAFMVAHHPQWEDVRQMIGRGMIGRLRHITGHFTYYNDDAGNIRNQTEALGGALRDIGIYPLGCARLVMRSEPMITHVEMSVEREVDATTRVMGRFGDVGFDFLVSMRILRDQRMQFMGERGHLELPAPFNPGSFKDGVLMHTDDDRIVRTRAYTGIDQYVRQVEAFHRTVADGVDYPCPLEFSRGTQAAMDAIFARANVG